MTGTTTTKRRPAGFVEELLLDMLSRAPQPLSASELTERIHRDGMDIYPSQIFRGLDRLCRRNLIHRLELTSGYAIGDSRCLGTVCAVCGSFRPLAAESALTELDNLASEYGFDIARYIVEVRGVCAHCTGA